MTSLSLSEALRPLAARLPKVVREYEVLRVAATVDAHGDPQALDKVRREILGWAQNRSGGRLPRDAWEQKDFDYLSGGRNSAGVRVVADDIDLWAIRADDPDRTIAGRVWTTEVIVGVRGANPPRFSARLLASTSEGELDIEPHTPGFLLQVVERCGLSNHGFRLASTPWVTDSADETERLVDLLVDPARRLPFLVLSVPERAERPLIDAASLARATIGIAQVVVVPATHSRVITRRLGKLHSVFGGAVRAYLPGFSEDSNPYAHRLVLPNIIATADGAAQTQRWMRWLAANESVRSIRMGKDILTFAAVRAVRLEARQRELESEGASETMQLAAANARIEALEREVESEKSTQEYFSEEHAHAEERATTAEMQLRASAFRISQLTEQLKNRGDDPDNNIAFPQTWSDFANWCDTSLAGRVVLSPRARSGVRSPEFEDPVQVARCLLWLANEGRAGRMAGTAGTLSEAIVEPGIRNSHCGGDQYDFTWQQQRYTVDWHIKSGGNTRDPKRCLRIYYFWDPTSEQIVVAEAPAHRRTSAS